MVRAVSGILIGTLLFCGIRAGGQGRDSGDELAGATVKLTNDRPSESIPVDEKTLAEAPPILAVTVTKVVNPERVSLGIAVYLTFVPAPSSARSSEQPQRKKSLIGNVSLYPPDHPAGFLLRTSGAFRELQAAGALSKSNDVRLLLEMKRIHEREPWSHVELVFATPEWRQTVAR